MVRDHFPAVLGHLKRALERLKQLMRSRAPDDKGWRRDDKVEREQMRLAWILYSVLRQQCFFPM
jgi:asparagine synthetase B (glutamine-hydrolysing)